MEQVASCPSIPHFPSPVRTIILTIVWSGIIRPVLTCSVCSSEVGFPPPSTPLILGILRVLPSPQHVPLLLSFLGPPARGPVYACVFPYSVLVSDLSTLPLVSTLLRSLPCCLRRSRAVGLLCVFSFSEPVKRLAESLPRFLLWMCSAVVLSSTNVHQREPGRLCHKMRPQKHTGFKDRELCIVGSLSAISLHCGFHLRAGRDLRFYVIKP